MSPSLCYATTSASSAQGERQILITMSPQAIHSLPTEVLTYIFLISRRSSNTSIASQEMLLTIAHVCPRWRQIALASGELWTSLLISFPVSTGELHRVRFWLQNSGTYLLRIIVDLRDPDWNFVEETHPIQWFEMQAIMGAILPEIQRWQEITIFADNWAPLHAFLHYVQNMFPPFLRKLSLKRSNPYFAAPSQKFAPAASRVFVPLFGNIALEELKIVELQGVHVDWGMVKPLRGLTSLSFGYHANDVLPCLAEFRDLLRSCPELDSLAITGWGPRFDRDTDECGRARSRDAILLPRLRVLEIGVMIPSYAVDLLSLFVVPALETLTLDDITRYDPQTLTHPNFSLIFDLLSGRLPSMVSSSYARSLKYLTIMNLDPGQESFRYFLQSLQELHDLKIRNCGVAALGALVPCTANIPCKHLRYLSVEECDPELLAYAISSRREQRASGPTEITFQQKADSLTHPLSPEEGIKLALLGIKVLPLQEGSDIQWRRFDTDDSEDLVAAILSEQWDVPGTNIE